jgi:hypothetical protein
MHARVTVVSAQPDQMEAFLSFLRERVLPQAHASEGFKGIISLVDRSTGKNLTATLWASEHAMSASESWADQLRTDAVEAAGVTEPPSVERYEVAVFEV